MSGTWNTADIAGKPADVYEPAQRPRFGVLHLHDLDRETLRDRPSFSRLFDELRLACVCPHGDSSWWGDRVWPPFDPHVSPEHYLLDQVLPSFQQRWGLGPRSVGVQGIGMGGQGALRLAFKHSERFPVAAALAAALDFHDLYGRGSALDEMYDSKEQARQDTALLHVHPAHYPPHLFFAIDPDDAAWFRGNDRLHEKLAALGITHQFDFTTRAGGHSWDYVNHMAERLERFVAAGLEQESRRLL
jgi:esterase/lipase superfamily enzyme